MNTLFYNDILTMINDNDTNDNDTNDNDNICLISQTPLTSDFIKLECNHTFNYSYIYEEIKNQKLGINKYETQKLKNNQLKCPYCRNIQNKILPYLENGCYPKIYGVNYPLKYCMLANRCDYMFKRGENKNTFCLKPCLYNKCKSHMNENKIKYCTGILKSGIHKGEKCSNRSYAKSDFCLKHKKKKR